MEKIIILWVLLLATAALPQDESRIIFNTDEMFVKLNETINLDCGFQGSYRYCLWEHAGEKLDTVDIYDGNYGGLSKPENIEGNQCGIVLDSAATEDHGVWTCKVLIKGEAVVASKNVTILVKPTQATVTPVDLTANSNEETSIECIVMKARPAVQLRWFLDEEDITEQSLVVETNVTSDGAFMSVSTLNRTFTPVDNEKELKCVVDHPTLEDSDIVKISVNVLYAPIKDIPQIFSVNETESFEIRVNFSANPLPFKVLWQYGESFDNLTNDIEITLDNENISTILETGVKGHYIAVLNISSLNESDFKRHYNLLVENEIGSTNYQVKLEPVSVNQKNDKTVMMGVVISGALVLIIGVITIVSKTCIANKEVIVASLGALPICCPPKESKVNEEEVKDPVGVQPVIVNIIVKNDETEKEDENGNEEAGYLVDKAMKDSVDMIEDSEKYESK